jgi:hypothetical protein
MPLILAVEPDRHQASQLQAIARGRLHAELVLEATAERALAALGDRIPDLILTAALLSPKDEAALAGRLRALNSAAAHIHTLTIPVLASPRSRPRMGGVLSALRRDKSPASEPDGCDPAVFAEQCATYLEQAMTGRTDVAGTTTYEKPALVPEETGQEPFATLPYSIEKPALVPEEIGQEPFESLPYSIDDAPNTLNMEAAKAAEDIRSYVDETIGEAPVDEPVSDASCDIAAEAVIAEPVDETVVADVIEEPFVFVEDTLDEAAMEAAVEARVLDEPLDEALDEPRDEPAAGQPLAAPIVEEIVDPPAVVDAAPSRHDQDVVLEESPLFELVSEAESESAAGTEEDLDRYIELDLSEFLDQSPMLHAVAASGSDDPSPEGPTETDANAAPLTPLAAGPAAPDEADWLEVVEALRRDVERLDATPAAPPRPHRPLKKARRKLKGKPIQDEWGFFDPEQCGFAALLAKLDEVVKADDPVRRKR